MAAMVVLQIGGCASSERPEAAYELRSECVSAEYSRSDECVPLWAVEYCAKEFLPLSMDRMIGNTCQPRDSQFNRSVRHHDMVIPRVVNIS